MFRRLSANARPSPSHSDFPPDSDLLSQKRDALHAYSYETAKAVPCSGLSPDSLVQQNKNACSSQKRQVAHLPQKPELFTFPTQYITTLSTMQGRICRILYLQ